MGAAPIPEQRWDRACLRLGTCKRSVPCSWLHLPVCQPRLQKRFRPERAARRGPALGPSASPPAPGPARHGAALLSSPLSPLPSPLSPLSPRSPRSPLRAVPSRAAGGPSAVRPSTCRPRRALSPAMALGGLGAGGGGAARAPWPRLLLALALAGPALPEVLFRCPPCTAERLAACPPASRPPCPELVREPGCGCCPVCARLEAEACGVYTPRCAAGLRCYPDPGAELPLQALVQGQGTCARRRDAAEYGASAERPAGETPPPFPRDLLGQGGPAGERGAGGGWRGEGKEPGSIPLEGGVWGSAPPGVMPGSIPWKGGCCCMGSPRVGGRKAGDPLGARVVGDAQGSGWRLGSYGEKSPSGGFRGKRGEMQPRGSLSGSRGRWRCTSGLGGGLKAPQRVTGALKAPDHALPGGWERAGWGAAMWGPPAPWPAAQRSPPQGLGPPLPPSSRGTGCRGEAEHPGAGSPKDGALQAPDLLLREAALPGMPMHGFVSAWAREGEAEGERKKTGGAGNFARRKLLLRCSERGRCGPRCCPPPLPGCGEHADVKSCSAAEYGCQGSEFYTLQKKPRAFRFKESGADFRLVLLEEVWGGGG
ncbi:insulin-like growth factor-binding protein 2 [Aix galericulata]|nr:insulin-like growth factor-binding protein 2 [Aix galericulata]